MNIAVSPQQKLETIYTEVLGDYADHKEFLWKHRGRFVHYVQAAVTDGLLDARFNRKHFKLERLSYELDPSRDELLTEQSLTLLRERDLLKNEARKLVETPQYFWMRQAMTKALGAPNPTRTALELYNKLSKEAHLPDEASYSSDIFNGQRLLFDATRLVREAGTAEVPEQYYKHGWVVLNEVFDEFEAIKQQEKFINSLDESKLPLHQRFRDRIQLAKADQIPVCDDVVASSFQVLHFDMGHPFVESEEQLFVSHVGIYLPKTTTHKVPARTRLVELDGLLQHLALAPEVIEQKLIDYVRNHGDGWTGHNTYRLACFARFLDALAAKHELADQTDKTVGQWFQNEDKLDEASAREKEIAFYARHSVDLSNLEHQIALEPGQLLILDNTRVIHGRIGKRQTKELFNFMWGVEAIKPADIAALRGYICKLVAAK